MKHISKDAEFTAAHNETDLSSIGLDLASLFKKTYISDPNLTSFDLTVTSGQAQTSLIRFASLENIKLTLNQKMSLVKDFELPVRLRNFSPRTQKCLVSTPQFGFSRMSWCSHGR